MKNNKTNKKKKLNRILTICTMGIQGNKHKDKGENPDNSIYLERGNNWQELHASPHIERIRILSYPYMESLSIYRYVG